MMFDSSNGITWFMERLLLEYERLLWNSWKYYFIYSHITLIFLIIGGLIEFQLWSYGIK